MREKTVICQECKLPIVPCFYMEHLRTEHQDTDIGQQVQEFLMHILTRKRQKEGT